MKRERPDIVPVLGVLCGVIAIATSFAFSIFLSNMSYGKYNLVEAEDSKFEIIAPIKPKRKIKVLLCTFVLMITILAILLTFGVVRISGHSMQPTLSSGDIAFYNRIITTVNLGDVIVFKRGDQRYIKRVFGRPGDRIRIAENGSVIVNDKPAIIENLVILGNTTTELATDEMAMGEGQYFVLGDNRNVSSDSRNNEIGIVSQSEILGVYCFAITTQ